MSLKGVIFDVDGTLVNTERDGHLVAFNLAFKDKCLDWEWDDKLYQYLLQITGGKERIKFYINEFHKNFQKDNLDEFIVELHKLKTDYFVQLVADGKAPLRTGVKRLIDEIDKSDLQMAIATTTTMANIEALIIHKLGEEYLDKFSIIAAGDVVANKKPAPDIYNYALEHMKLKPEECIAIEDSENGLKSSLDAKIPTLITINDYTKDQDFTGAKIVLDSLGDENSDIKVDVNFLENLLN
ncbi:Hypothetical protein CbbY [hydrothermal vent metagenome]|uniref:Phosphatase n=1 Tax=hydrothermal vent metagenome TaxID=652676 RepID=A0A1W1CNN9_9ZZZZ